MCGPSQFGMLFTFRNPMNNLCSILKQVKKVKYMNYWYVPSFCCCMLSVSIGDFSLANTLKFGQDGAILRLCLCQHLTSCFNITCHSCCLDLSNTPANLCMTEQITCQVPITFVKEPVHIATVTPSAPSSPTFKDVCMMAILVLNLGSCLEECINRQSLFLGHAFYVKLGSKCK